MDIDRRVRSIQTKRVQLVHRLSDMEPAQVAARPRPDKWSIQEIVEHLVLAETDVFGDLDALERREPLRRSLKDRVLYMVVMFILRFDIPVKVPSSGMMPEGDRAIDQLQPEWEANHRRLQAWIEGCDEHVLRRPLFSHPVAGPMTTTDALRMLDVHLDRHVRQINEIIRQAPSVGAV